MAIHRVFDTSRDRLVFDVGHQCYVHKALTGRQALFETLRQFGGLSGFPKPYESEHDAFIAGHASNSVSVALGMARARTLRHEDYSVLALIGDGAMSGGTEPMRDSTTPVRVAASRSLSFSTTTACPSTPTWAALRGHLSRTADEAGLLSVQEVVS